MPVSSAKVRPTGTSSNARRGKIKAAPAPVIPNQVGASASQPPITAPDAMAIIEIKLRFLFSFGSDMEIHLSFVDLSECFKQFLGVDNMAVDVV